MASDVRFAEFTDELREEVNRLREELGEGLRKSFVLTMCNRIPLDDIEDVQTLFVNKKIGSRKIAIDGYVFNSEENTLTLLIADWNEFENNNNLISTEVDGLLRGLRAFFELSRSGKLVDEFEFSTPEYDLDELIRKEVIDRIHLVIVTDRLVSDRIRHLKVTPIKETPADADIWGVERLFDFACSDSPQEPIHFDFSDQPIKLALATKGEGYESYLGVMPATILAKLYQEHGGRLLEGNVRSFLTLKTSVNRDIRGTIIGRPEKFFIYNNGIAVTARDIEFDDAGDMIGATDFQIINGGQTTASLARAVTTDHADVSQIQVAMKLTYISDALPQDEALELMRNISRYSNNQNKVSGADFSSNHPLHVRIEKCSERIVAPPAPGVQYGSYWFYERNRGSYEQKKMFLRGDRLREFERKYSKKQLVRKEDLAKVRLCFNQMPHIVSKGAATLFAKFMEKVDETWSKDDEKGVYGDQFFRDSIALVIMYNKLRDAVSQCQWYEGGYRANIVAYSIAIFFRLFENNYGTDTFNFQLIWNMQALPEDMLVTLLRIAQKVKEDVLTYSERKKENVTEWAKMEMCWAFAKEKFDCKSDVLPITAEQWKISASQKTAAKHDARVVAKMDAGIDLQTQVCNYKYWQEAWRFDRQNSILAPLQSLSISKASKIPTVIPTERDCERALKALEQLRREGFSH